jgi:4-hydroxybenzoate polyprenyltransferase
MGNTITLNQGAMPHSTADQSISGQYSGSSNIPLCVDLDGTLIRTDLLFESFLALVKANPFNFFRCLGWLLKGKAYLKAEIAKRVSIDISLLPYNQKVIDLLAEARANGRDIHLCTASDQAFAHQVSAHLGGFTRVFASDGRTNLSRSNKCKALEDTFGRQGFDYIGNSMDDIPIWKSSRNALIVGNNGILKAASGVNANTQVIDSPEISLGKIFKAMRVYQWVKNVLIFVPLLVSHRFVEVDAILATVMAFFAFSLCASSVYLLNDMLDLDADRRHERKRHRPFASGELSLTTGMMLTVVLLLGSIAIAAFLPPKFMLVIASYYALTLAYSFLLKKLLLVDVFALASLYTARIMAGGAAAAIPLSSWLVMFSITIFLSLAFLKRYAELDDKLRAGGKTAAGRGYLTDDIEILRSFGTSAGYLAVIIMAIYLNSDDTTLLYSHRSALWGVFASLLFWISWMWMQAFKGKMHDDPIVFALKNRTSLAAIAVTILFMLIAI